MTDPLPPPTAPTAVDPERTVARRTSLPGGRAVVGGLLVAVAALGTYTAHQQASAAPTTPYVVAAVDIDPGARLGADLLRVESLRLAGGVAEGAFTSPADLDGAVAVAPMRAGELLQRSAIVPAGAGETSDSPPSSEFSFAVERTRAVNGSLNRGERVDLLATYGTGEAASTHVVVRGALVTDVDNEPSDSIGAASTVTVTLSLPSRDELLEAAHATQVADVTLVRATKARDDSDLSLDVFEGPQRVGEAP